ncbi:MAG: hypothetical protein O2960_07475, partial [Verrucomicrobia bacterium]|nr:hypothetical protein [Verrucomicrobiota bacterium]
LRAEYVREFQTGHSPWCSRRRPQAEVRQKLTGHADAAMHQRYTHLELLPLKQAIATLPSVLNGNA